MANELPVVSQKENRLGSLSLFFLAVAVVGPFVGSFARLLGRLGGPLAGIDPVVISVGLRLAFLLLALAFGIFGRQSRSGRFGLIGSGVLLAIGFLVILYLVSRPAVPAVHPAPSLPPPR
jgi:hypothetical protein